MKTSRRAFLGLGAGALLAGCGRTQSTRDVSFWAAFSRPEQESYVDRHLVGAYNATSRRPVRMTLQQTSTVDRTVQTAVASGRGPDLFPTPGPAQVLMYLDAEKLHPLDDYAERFGWEHKLQRWAMDASKIRGRLYSVPIEYESMVLLYNPRVFEDHGWHPPADRADFESICAEAKRAGIMPVAAGNADYRPATEWLVTAFLNHYCGPVTLYDALAGRRPWTDRPYVEAIDLLASYYRRGWIGGGTEAYFTNKNDALYTKLASGEAAMMIVGSWGFSDAAGFFGSAAGNDERWEWSYVPALSPAAPAKFFEMAIGSSVVVNRDSAVPLDAARYLDWRLSSSARAGRALADVTLAPPPIHIPASAFPAGLDAPIERFFADLDSRSPRGYTTWTHWPPKSNNHMYRGMDRVIVGKESAMDYCKKLQQLFTEERDAGHAPPIPEPTA